MNITKPKWKFLTGDINWLDYGGKWISQKMNNGEFDFWYVREILNCAHSVGEREADRIPGKPKYWVTISIVSPDEFEDKKEALNSFGIDESWENLSNEMKVELVHGYAGGASVFNEDGRNYKKLFKEANKIVEQQSITFGFTMDKPQNGLGATGWDWIKGNMAGPFNHD